MMEQQRSAMANSRIYVNGASHLNSLGIATNYDDAAQLLKRDTEVQAQRNQAVPSAKNTPPT